ncbi:hypothetical protein Tco_1522866 [Tanacetum coccineum]
MAVSGDIDKIEDVNANCVLMANLQQASTSSIQIGKALVYDSDGTSELLEPISEPHQVQQNNSNVIPDASSMEQSGGTVDQNPATAEEIRAHFESSYNNLATEVERVKMVNRKMRETNADLTTELARYKAKPDSFYHTEHKMALGYPNPYYLKQAQQKQQSMYNGRVLLENHDPPVVYDSEETLQLAQESRLKMKQLNKEIKLANYAKIDKLSKIFVSQKAKSREEVYFSNTSKMANVSTLFSIPDEESSDDTPSVARKFLNEVKDTLMTLQCVVKHRMNGNITNLSSSTHQEIHKIFKDEIIPIVNQVDARVQNFENHFMKEAAKFVRDFKSLAKEADDSLDKIKEEKLVPNKPLRASVRTKPITVSQPSVIDKKTVNSNSNGSSSTGVDNTTKTRIPQSRSNTKNDRVPSVSKSRRFYACPIQGSQCRWIDWVDLPMCPLSVQIIPGLLRARNRHEASI